MRLNFLSLAIFGALALAANAQSCSSVYTTCSSCVKSPGATTWCTNAAYSSTSGCCVSSISYFCPSNYQLYTPDCNVYSSNPNYIGYVYVACNGACIAWIVISILAWIANMCFVFRFCKQRNLEPCGYIAIAFFFGWWVWCCLVSAGRRQLVIVQTGPQPYVPYQAQPANSAPNGYNPAYGQPAGYAPQGYPQAQPSNPYVQQPQNPYAQPANPYTQEGLISKPQ